MNSIKIDNLSFKYKNSKNVLNNINLELEAGHIILLAGNNGAGKSTLIKCLLGFIKNYTGKINYFHNNVLININEFLKITGAQFQQLTYFNTLTVKETFSFFMRLYSKYDKYRINKLLNILGLYSICNKRLDKISGGQQQRVNIGLSLLNKPKFLILDEPTNGLDTNFRINFWNIVNKLNNQNTTILLVTHHMNEVQNIINEVAFLKNGRIVNKGTFKNIKIQKGVDYKLTIKKNDQLSNDFLKANGFSKINNKFIKYSNYTKSDQIIDNNTIVEYTTLDDLYKIIENEKR